MSIQSPLNQSVVNKGPQCGVEVRILSYLSTGQDFRVLGRQGTFPEIEQAYRNVVAKKREQVDQIQSLSVVQAVKIIHDAQEGLGKLLVCHLIFHAVFLNRLARRVKTMADGMNGEW
jgi:hypothetical protein